MAPDFTAVHAIHITAEEIELLARSDTTVCSCPTTERNLGDGVIAADQVMREGIRIAFGSDSQAQIDPLEDARELEYHLRLERQQRAILDQIGEQTLASRLFDCATVNGARALGVPAGEFTGGFGRLFHRGSGRCIDRRATPAKICCLWPSSRSTGRLFAM